MSILINKKEVFINNDNIVYIEVSDSKTALESAVIHMIGGKVISLEPYSWTYFKTYRSSSYTTFNMKEYVKFLPFVNQTEGYAKTQLAKNTIS